MAAGVEKPACAEPNRILVFLLLDVAFALADY